MEKAAENPAKASAAPYESFNIKYQLKSIFRGELLCSSIIFLWWFIEKERKEEKSLREQEPSSVQHMKHPGTHKNRDVTS